jgi:tRNA G18 (ribose-2'-O)-methylase SpoU
MRQLDHHEFKSGSHRKSIILICSHLQSPTSLGSICRIAEAFGVLELYIDIQNEPFLKLPRFIKASRHSHKYLTINFYNEVEGLIQQLKKQDYFLVALEYCDNSKSLNLLKSTDKTAIIIGHEIHGIEKNILDNVDDVAHIEMYGKNSSMNVSHATAIALYHSINFS